VAGSQILTVLPLLPLARRLPSGAQATDLTQSQCSVSWHSSSPVGFQILTVLSQLPLGGEKCCDPRCCPAARSCVCRAVPFWHGVCLVARRNETPCHFGTASRRRRATHIIARRIWCRRGRIAMLATRPSTLRGHEMCSPVCAQRRRKHPSESDGHRGGIHAAMTSPAGP